MKPSNPVSAGGRLLSTGFSQSIATSGRAMNPSRLTAQKTEQRMLIPRLIPPETVRGDQPEYNGESSDHSEAKEPYQGPKPPRRVDRREEPHPCFAEQQPEKARGEAPGRVPFLGGRLPDPGHPLLAGRVARRDRVADGASQSLD